jgi:hypothetical protein
MNLNARNRLFLSRSRQRASDFQALLELVHHHVGLQVAEVTISNLLIKEQDIFHAEKAAVLQTGVRASPWQQIDDTHAPQWAQSVLSDRL